MKLPCVVKYSLENHGTYHGLLVRSDEKDYLIPIANEQIRVLKFRADGGRSDFAIREYLDQYPVADFWKVVRPKAEKYGITEEAKRYMPK